MLTKTTLSQPPSALLLKRG